MDFQSSKFEIGQSHFQSFNVELTKPAKKNLLLYSQASGPPLSPLHASTPPCNKPSERQKQFIAYEWASQLTETVFRSQTSTDHRIQNALGTATIHIRHPACVHIEQWHGGGPKNGRQTFSVLIRDFRNSPSSHRAPGSLKKDRKGCWFVKVSSTSREV